MQIGKRDDIWAYCRNCGHTTYFDIIEGKCICKSCKQETALTLNRRSIDVTNYLRSHRTGITQASG